MDITITQDFRRKDNSVLGYVGNINNRITFEAKVYDGSPNDGVDHIGAGSRIQSISGKKDGKEIFNFSRSYGGWRMEPDSPEDLEIAKVVAARLNRLSNIHNLNQPTLETTPKRINENEGYGGGDVMKEHAQNYKIIETELFISEENMDNWGHVIGYDPKVENPYAVLRFQENSNGERRYHQEQYVNSHEEAKQVFNERLKIDRALAVSDGYRDLKNQTMDTSREMIIHEDNHDFYVLDAKWLSAENERMGHYVLEGPLESLSQAKDFINNNNGILVQDWAKEEPIQETREEATNQSYTNQNQNNKAHGQDKTQNQGQKKENDIMSKETTATKNNINISARVNPLNDQSKNVKAMASVTIDNVVAIKNLSIVEGKNGLFVSYPQFKAGENDFRNIVDFVRNEDGQMTKNSANLKDTISKTLIGMYRNNQRELEAENKEPVNHDVRAFVTPLRESENATKGLATLQVSDMLRVNAIRVNENMREDSDNFGKNFVSMPSRQDSYSKTGYSDIVHPVTKEFKEKVDKAILSQYDRQLDYQSHGKGKEQTKDTTRDNPERNKPSHDGR